MDSALNSSFSGWSFPEVIFRYLVLKCLNASAASCRCIKYISFMSLTLTSIIKIKIMTYVMRWMAKAALKGACGSKATTIEKVIPRNTFSFQRIPSQKTKIPLVLSELKKNHLPVWNTYSTNHSATTGRRVSYSPTTYVFCNNYKSIPMAFIPYYWDPLPARSYCWWHLGYWVLKKHHLPKIKKTVVRYMNRKIPWTVRNITIYK